jgi:hypothetical protein
LGLQELETPIALMREHRILGLWNGLESPKDVAVVSMALEDELDEGALLQLAPGPFIEGLRMTKELVRREMLRIEAKETKASKIPAGRRHDRPVGRDAPKPEQ